MKLANFRWVFLPYCLDEQDDGRWAVLNRDYKPLGMLTGEYVDYDGHSLWLRGVTAPREARARRRQQVPRRIYLYDDGCPPDSSPEAWASYAAKLRRLAALSVSDSPFTQKQENRRVERLLEVSRGAAREKKTP